jgi:hypothetical protein
MIIQRLGQKNAPGRAKLAAVVLLVRRWPIGLCWGKGVWADIMRDTNAMQPESVRIVVQVYAVALRTGILAKTTLWNVMASESRTSAMVDGCALRTWVQIHPRGIKTYIVVTDASLTESQEKLTNAHSVEAACAAKLMREQVKTMAMILRGAPDVEVLDIISV